jgi:hypothetical protein
MRQGKRPEDLPSMQGPFAALMDSVVLLSLYGVSFSVAIATGFVVVLVCANLIEKATSIADDPVLALLLTRRETT